MFLLQAVAHTLAREAEVIHQEAIMEVEGAMEAMVELLLIPPVR